MNAQEICNALHAKYPEGITHRRYDYVVDLSRYDLLDPRTSRILDHYAKQRAFRNPYLIVEAAVRDIRGLNGRSN